MEVGKAMEKKVLRVFFKIQNNLTGSTNNDDYKVIQLKKNKRYTKLLEECSGRIQTCSDFMVIF